MNRDFKIGDKVISVIGKGVVHRIDYNAQHPVEVKMDKTGQFWHFSLEGKESEIDKYPSLFHIDKAPEQWKKQKTIELECWANIKNNNTITFFTDSQNCKQNIDVNDVATMVKLKGKYLVKE